MTLEEAITKANQLDLTVEFRSESEIDEGSDPIAIYDGNCSRAYFFNNYAGLISFVEEL